MVRLFGWRRDHQHLSGGTLSRQMAAAGLVCGTSLRHWLLRDAARHRLGPRSRRAVAEPSSRGRPARVEQSMTRTFLAFPALALLLAACASVPRATDSLDAAARDYVRLQLAIGEKEEGYIDAYYGPPELQAEAKAEAAAQALPQLAAGVDALSARVARLARTREEE